MSAFDSDSDVPDRRHYVKAVILVVDVIVLGEANEERVALPRNERVALAKAIEKLELLGDPSRSRTPAASRAQRACASYGHEVGRVRGARSIDASVTRSLSRPLALRRKTTRAVSEGPWPLRGSV